MVVRAEDSEILDHYSLPDNVRDEMFAASGEVRPHWAYFAKALTALGPYELARRQREIQRLVRENGITYNLYRDGQAEPQAWLLDPIPLLIDSTEWARIESGLIQRAELLNLILADLYGPRTLIRQGLVPPELIYTHKHFLRSCDQVLLAGERQLILYAADLFRGPDGQVKVLSDRTQAPSGMGYALANRTVLTHALPSLFREAQVHRLARFFLSLRETLGDLAGSVDSPPKIAIHTPGPFNETFFEHTYLAGYLGYPLIQGSDLMVRDGRVWINALERLDSLEVILRRVDGDFLDPLELRPDSQLGVPGLIETMRRQQVAIVNPPGSGILENPALMAFLPRLAKQLLGQDLRLPGVMTWWCGEAEGCEYVLAHLDELIIKPVSRGANERPVFGSQLNPQELETWRQRIRARPHLFVGQERVTPSTTPSFVESRLEPRPVILRSFLVGRREDYQVMPGGLARVGPHPEALYISNQAGAMAKDTWVLASEPEKRISLWPQPAPAAVIPAWRGTLPAAMADNLFWLGRYGERCEALTRSLRSVLTLRNQVVEFDHDSDRECLRSLVQALAWQAALPVPPLDTRRDAENLMGWLLGASRDAGGSCTLAANLGHLARTAGAVRDQLSEDSIHALNQLNRLLESALAPDELELEKLLDELVLALSALTGLIEETMVRWRGWLFVDIGRRLERGMQTSALAKYALATPASEIGEELKLEAFLRTLGSLTAYRRDYGMLPRFAAVLELALLDTANPRSLAWQLLRLKEHMTALPGDETARDLITSAFTALREVDPQELVQRDDSGRCPVLAQLMEEEMQTLVRLSDTLAARYFTERMPRLL